MPTKMPKGVARTKRMSGIAASLRVNLELATATPKANASTALCSKMLIVSVMRKSNSDWAPTARPSTKECRIKAALRAQSVVKVLVS